MSHRLWSFIRNQCFVIVGVGVFFSMREVGVYRQVFSDFMLGW